MSIRSSMNYYYLSVTESEKKSEIRKQISPEKTNEERLDEEQSLRK